MLKKIVVAAALVFAFSSVARAQDVSRDFDKEANFAAIKTFYAKIGTGWGNPITEKRVQAEIEQELETKGWKKAADEKSADAVVVLHGATQIKKDLNTFYSGMGGYGYGYRGWGGGMGTAQTTVSEYKVGTLVVDIFDAKSKNLIYRGTASDEISDKPEKNQKKMQKVADKLFKDFPPGSKKD